MRFSNHWGRLQQSYGYEVRLAPGQFIRPFVKSNKNDCVDAETIAATAVRPGMQFVAVNSRLQQDLQAFHRVRADVIQQRTAKANQIRGLAAEYGIIALVGLYQLRKAIPEWQEDVHGLSDLFRPILGGLRHDLVAPDDRVEVLTRSIQQVAERDPVAKRLLSLRGAGPLCATAMAIELGDGQQFRRGRDFAASLGLVPRQRTSGKATLLDIVMRGDAYTRKLLVHGARAMIRHHEVKEDPLHQWIGHQMAGKHPNVVSVALANKAARIDWAITRGATYQSGLAAKAA